MEMNAERCGEETGLLRECAPALRRLADGGCVGFVDRDLTLQN